MNGRIGTVRTGGEIRILGHEILSLLRAAIWLKNRGGSADSANSHARIGRISFMVREIGIIRADNNLVTMPPTVRQPALETHDLIHELEYLHSEMLGLVSENLPAIAEIPLEHRTSAMNLLHYLALRRHDIRILQERLAALGLSSLGRTEAHVLSTVRAVMDVLASLNRSEHCVSETQSDACERDDGRRMLKQNTDLLLGPEPKHRSVRIMVTVPSEAATNYKLVRDLVASGMNCMRINCAHDNPEAWSGMIRNLRQAQAETGKSCRIEMDVAGPKLRTGPIEPGPEVVKYRPQRDEFGRVLAPARIWLTPSAHPEPPPGSADACVPVPGAWLSKLNAGDIIRFVDTSGRKRSMSISGTVGRSRWAESAKAAYLGTGLSLIAKGKRCRIGRIAAKARTISLKSGDTLILTRSLEPGRPAAFNDKGKLVRAATIGVTLPEFFDCVRRGDAIWIDDGKIRGTVSAVKSGRVAVEILQTPAGGAKLGAEKGINVPETNLRVSPLTADDLRAFEFIVKNADIVGYSFVRTEEDIRDLQARLSELGGEHLGIVLKIETAQGFENLPRLLLAAMRSRAVGVMIARGDLAVECGYQRLAEAQEEILWISEAAHVPVIWATQVLESLAKTGMPSRSEITDAAMGERAECVMLNKGPYIVEAVKTLDDILGRMQTHQEKKRSMLRKLRIASSARLSA